MRYVCSICGYVYDEAREKLPFLQLPEGWQCPVCKAAKSLFTPEQKEEAPKPAKESDKPEKISLGEEEAEKISAGELAALCSNLARAVRNSIKIRKRFCSVSWQIILLGGCQKYQRQISQPF